MRTINLHIAGTLLTLALCFGAIACVAPEETDTDQISENSEATVDEAASELAATRTEPSNAGGCLVPTGMTDTDSVEICLIPSCWYTEYYDVLYNQCTGNYENYLRSTSYSSGCMKKNGVFWCYQ